MAATHRHRTRFPADPPAATTGDPAAGLVVGHGYHLTYRSTTQRRDRGAVMVYLGTDYGTDTGPSGEVLLFDARPAAGTQRLPRTWLRSAHAVPDDTPPYLNKIEP